MFEKEKRNKNPTIRVFVSQLDSAEHGLTFRLLSWAVLFLPIIKKTLYFLRLQRIFERTTIWYSKKKKKNESDGRITAYIQWQTNMSDLQESSLYCTSTHYRLGFTAISSYADIITLGRQLDWWHFKSEILQSIFNNPPSDSFPPGRNMTRPMTEVAVKEAAATVTGVWNWQIWHFLFKWGKTVALRDVFWRCFLLCSQLALSLVKSIPGKQSAFGWP